EKFENELYITIISSGMNIEVNLKNFSGMFFTGSLIKEHNKIVDDNCIKLTRLTDNILETLADYSPVKLTMKPDDNGYHSELLSFFGNIIQLDSERMNVLEQDLSKQLSKYKVAFGNNAFEVKHSNKTLFAMMLSVKDCSGVSKKAIDKFLQLPYQFVVTQSMNFGNVDESLEFYKHQNYILNISGDREFKDISGLSGIIEKDSGDAANNLAFCQTQTTIMVIAETLEDLEKIGNEVGMNLFSIGIPVVREDVNMENCFWSQLPANFSYISRKKTMLVSKLGHFASLCNFPFGSLDSKWGEYVTLLRTNLGTTYFFNFHVDDNGHTIIIGDANSGKKTILNFLLSESSKLSPKTLYIDSVGDSKLYIEAVGGIYKTFSFDDENNNLKLNPLLLEDNKENREYLRYWFLYLLDKYTDPSDIENYMASIDSAVGKIYSAEKSERKLSNAKQFFTETAFAELNKKILKDLSMWHGKGKFAHVFDNDEDDLISNNAKRLLGIDMTAAYDTPMGVNLPVINYILHYFKSYYTGKTPSIMAVADCNRLFNSVYFEKNLGYIIDDLTKRNSIMVATASFSSERVNWSATVGAIYNQKMQTKIFLSDGSSFDNVNKIFELSGEERMYLEAFDIKSREFIIRQANHSMVSVMDIGGFEVSLGILSGGKKYKKIVEELKKKHGDDPKIWLRKLYENTEV
ncbi:MAG: hypothetical protein K0T99_03525, partial [Alphaproteobacteria bacterium]|nr:hypothetical protein [Alphaproteobacteria bacterium]